MDRQAEKHSGCDTRARITPGLRPQHSSDLLHIHPHRPHGAVLFEPRRHAHGDAVDNIEGRNDGDNSEEPIDKDRKGIVCSLRTLTAQPVIRKLKLFSRQLSELFCGLFPCAALHLDVDDRIVCLPGQFCK